MTPFDEVLNVSYALFMVLPKPQKKYILDGLFSGAFNAISTHFTNETNKTLTRETNAQNLALQKEQWAREDNAYQRKVADLKAAGLNPALALGGGSDSSLSAQMQAPHMEAPRLPDNLGIEDGVFRSIQAAQGFQQLGIQQELADAEVASKNAQTALTGAQADLARQGLLQSQLDYSVNQAFQYQQAYQNLRNSGVSEQEARHRIEQIEAQTKLQNQAYQGFADTGTWSGVPMVSSSGTVHAGPVSTTTSTSGPIGHSGSSVANVVDNAIDVGGKASGLNRLPEAVNKVQEIRDAVNDAIHDSVLDAKEKAQQLLKDRSESKKKRAPRKNPSPVDTSDVNLGVPNRYNMPKNRG